VAAATAWRQRDVSGGSSVVGSMVAVWHRRRRWRQHYDELMIFLYFGIFFFLFARTPQVICDGNLVPYGVFGKEWTEMTSPTSPHCVFRQKSVLTARKSRWKGRE
jgi:hypothetical protein